MINEQITQLKIKNQEISKLDSVSTSEDKFHVIDNNQSYKTEIITKNFNQKTYQVKVNNNTYNVNINNSLDDLIKESISRAYIEVKKRRKDELKEKEMENIAKTIGIAAIRFNIIKVQPEKDIVFK